MSKLETSPKERRNGFECPLSCQQVGIWINTATTLGTTIAWLIVPAVKEIMQHAEDDLVVRASIHGVVSGLLMLLFLVSLVLTVRLAYICTATSPTDILVHK